MTDWNDASLYGDAYADVYDDWYDLADTDPAVQFLATAARGRPVLELGVGTGRLALPLAALGLDVWGVDASEAMLDRLRAKSGAGAVRAVHTDMATLELPDEAPLFGLVFAAFNTFFLMSSIDAQRATLRRIRSLLEPDGRLVLEVFVPMVVGPRAVLEVTSMATDRLVLRALRASSAGQGTEGLHVEITENGIRLRPWRMCPLLPAQLDSLALDADLVLVDRSGGWRGELFLDTGLGPTQTHVSVYEPAPPA